MQNTLQRAVEHWEMVAPMVATPKTQEDYEMLLDNFEQAMTLFGKRDNSPMTGLITAMSNAAMEYEGKTANELKGNGLEALRYLIKLHRIQQNNLKEIGSQGVVSEILNGKRSLTLRHVRALAKRFNVSPSTFIDE